jgi:hypothetical protein
MVLPLKPAPERQRNHSFENALRIHCALVLLCRWTLPAIIRRTSEQRNPYQQRFKWLLAGLVLRRSVRQIQSREFSKRRRTILPLLGGEGRGEDGRLI